MMASRELDEHNEHYTNTVNNRIWNMKLRAAMNDIDRAIDNVRDYNYRELIATHNLDGDGLTRPRKHRVA
jgi:hypothetical protein